MKRTFLFLFLSIIGFTTQAQNTVQVTCIVQDGVTNEALIGVTVMVVGGKSAAMTDIYGGFSLNVPQNGVIRLSYLGFLTQEKTITESTRLEIKMMPDKQALEEVVVVGYSVMKKRDILGAVSKLNGSELTMIPVASAQQALQGRVAGVQVSSQTGAPGSNISVRIRGVGSISSGTASSFHGYVAGLKHGWKPAEQRIKDRMSAEINLNPDEPFSHEFLPYDLSVPGCWWPSTRVFSWNVFVLKALEVAGMRVTEP